MLNESATSVRGVLLFLAQSLMCFIANPFKTRSPFRFRDRAAGIFRDAAADVTGASKLIIRGGQRGSGSGIIGEVDALSANAAPWATEEDVLKDVREGCAQNDISSDFVVGDLLSGKVTRKLSKIRKLGEKKNNE